MNDEAIRRLLTDSPKLSLVHSLPGFVAISRDRIVERQGEDVARAVDAWVERVGGRLRRIRQPVSQGLRRGRIVAPDPGPSAGVWDVPLAALSKSDA